MNHKINLKFSLFNKNIFIIFLFLILIIFSSCEANIQGTGYEINDKIVDLTDQEIYKVLKNVKLASEPMYLGTVQIPNLSDIKVEKTSNTEIYSGDVETYIEKLRDKNVEYYYDYKKFVSFGDMLNIDFVGSVDNIEYPELCTNPDNGGVMLAIGSGDFIKGFENQLIAKRTRRTYPVVVTLPDDYPNPLIAGKVATFRVTINRIYSARTPDTDENFYYRFSPSKSTNSFIFRQEIGNMLTDERNFMINMEYQTKIKDELLKNSIYIPTNEAIAWQLSNVISKDLETASKYKITFEELIQNAGYSVKEYYASAVNKAINNLKPIMLSHKLRDIYSDIKISDENRKSWFFNFKNFAGLHENSTYEQLIKLYGNNMIEDEIYDYYIYQRLQSVVSMYEPGFDMSIEEEEELESLEKQNVTTSQVDNIIDDGSEEIVNSGDDNEVNTPPLSHES